MSKGPFSGVTEIMIKQAGSLRLRLWLCPGGQVRLQDERKVKMSTEQQSLLATCLLLAALHRGFAEQASWWSWCAVTWECCQLLKTLLSECLLSHAHSASFQHEQKKKKFFFIVTARQQRIPKSSSKIPDECLICMSNKALGNHQEDAGLS